ncbi:S-adenosylmethionine:tRNA ribosyltransferase-isomerase [Pendulispora albinea]|uniref:S-adenosylmethionine:tRNA ribosyltransferase-isomerase n=2 Tax=Pendulispora albinea TaxID=2741071 RepID=A0ABZ2MD02_9BACT
MHAATWPREHPLEERLLHIDPKAGTIRDAKVGDLPAMIRPGDLVIVNDAATLPGSLFGRTASGDPIELRLLARQGAPSRWKAVLFGAGDWRTKTEDRPAPPRLEAGDTLILGRSDLRLEGWRDPRSDPHVEARIEAIDPASPRLVTLRTDATLHDLYRIGRPVQYAYLERDLALWDVQTAYAARPWAAEMPSAGRPLTWGLLLELRRRGAKLASLTHAAGLSSTGDPELDARLPLAERYDIPAETAAAIQAARRSGQRIVAIGTTVVRALEGAASAHDGRVPPGEGETNLRIGPGFEPRIVDGLLTGVHDPAASHFALLAAFAPRELLARAYEHAERGGYLGHEFGDSSLILPA